MRRGSKITPSILGFLVVRMVKLLRVKGGLNFSSWRSGVKRVHEDLSGEIVRRFLEAHCSITGR